MQKVDRLLNESCYIIDFLPKQVEKNCGGCKKVVIDYMENENI